MNSVNLWKNPLEIGLKDDGYPWDWTTMAAFHGKETRKTHARLLAKSQGIWAADGLFDAAMDLSREMGFPFEIQSTFHNGKEFKPGDLLADWQGSAKGILILERPVINLGSFACGIATATHRLVQKVSSRKLKNPPRVTATRKTLPGYRDISIQSVLAGGGFSHRVSLSGGVLVKENHVAVAGGIGAAIDGARKLAPHSLRIECEVRDLKELQQAIDAAVDAVLLDNFTPEQVAEGLKVVARAARKPVVEVSGGINASNIESYALEGVDVISSGGLTHSVTSSDLSLQVE